MPTIQKKFIKFSEGPTSPSGKTRCWYTWNLGDVHLGPIFWFAKWRQYVFSPAQNTVFDPSCLRDIADFCEQQTKEHRLKKVRTDCESLQA